MPMKKTGLFAASVAAASATALSAPSSSAGVLKTTFSHQEKVIIRDEESSPSRISPPSTAADQFAPRFDGLRFIETLVTAHR
ncbi:uncharacterized protein LOC111468357 [Cucurbita maxima]|uniref:Uncharacterized protein LOC111468357 n=1 Tax=Cucurbita maxima TaxID=3661 RepID=A0A6J1I0M0_CUCMA|nr:uncharacterized protein LOC111468357 [Cucurbita maxima]